MEQITTFEQLIDAIATACRKHDAIESFDAGSSEYFYSENRNPVFPHGFFQFTEFSRAGTRLTLTGNFMMLFKLPSQEAYDKDTDAFNWNRNGVTPMDAAKLAAEEVITLIDLDNYNGNLEVSRNYTGVFSGNNTTSSIGWMIPLQISVESPIDPNDIATTDGS